MITLEVEEYCQNCPDFEADVKKTHAFAIGKGMREETANETVVRCEHSVKCYTMMNYLRKYYGQRNEISL